MPYPEDLNNHFVVDPAKFDFYAMDGYRLVGDDKQAEMYAKEVLRSSTLPDGREIKPMRAAEARITLGVLAGRADDLDRALDLGERALSGDRKSLPSLLMVASSQNCSGPDSQMNRRHSSFIEKVRALGQ